MQQVSRLAFLSHRKFLGQQVWLHKGVRTLIVVAPGLAVFLMTGNPLAVTFAFAALCLSVPYGDQNFRPAHLLCLAPLAAVFMVLAVWLQRHPILYVLVIALVGAALVLISRSATLPPRITTWFLIYVLYQSNELRSAGFQAAIFAALLVAPAAAWTYVACSWFWPHRGAPESGGAGKGEQMNAPLQALCAALSTASAAAVAFACHLYHANWAIWSAYTVIRPSRSVSLKRSAQRILGAVIGCSIGFLAIETLRGIPVVLAVLTVLAVFLMVAFEKYALAVSVRSALAPLAAFALHYDPLETAEARFLCILIGVIIGTLFMLLFTSERLVKVYAP
jgi:hypothetical protein